MAKRLGKRKVDSECRVFNQKWTSDSFFVQCKEVAVCLICQENSVCVQRIQPAPTL